MGEAIVITSGKGGVGKTTTTVNIGTALALFGKKVCLVDSDIGLRNLDVLMGLENRIIFNLVDVAQGRCKLNAALIRDKRFDCLHVLPAAQTVDKTAIQPRQMKKIIDELKQDYDYVLIDCPAGIEHGFKTAIEGADKSIVVTTPEAAAVRDADRVIGLLEQKKGMEPPKLIINRIRKNLVRSGEMLDVDEVVSILAIELLGIVIDDDAVIAASNGGEPIALDPSSKASIAYRNIARRILGESVPLSSFGESQGFFSKLKKIIGIR